MILGKGMLAKVFNKYDQDNIIFFCSGVSNSQEENSTAFKREKKLIDSFKDCDQKLIYFSSYFVNFENYLSKRYYQHKLEMEQLIQEYIKNYTIYRLPQVVGRSENPNTLTNFLAARIKGNEQLPIYNHAVRNVIDLDTVATVVNYANENRLFECQTVNLITPQNYQVSEIVQVLEKILGETASKINIESEEAGFDILLSNEMKDVYQKLHLYFDKTYLINLMEKYYKRSEA